MKGVYGLIKGFADTIKHSFIDYEVPKLEREFDRIAVVGMGANYNAALLLKEMLREEISVEVYQREFIPEKKTLAIFMSYSGNTKEVLNVYENYLFNKSTLAIASGGELLKIARRKKSKFIEIPPHLHPRFTFSECFFPILHCLEFNGIIKSKKRIITHVHEIVESYDKKVELEAKKLSQKINDKIPLFYGTPYFYPLAYRFQSSVEEDDKKICHANTISELFHNELEALPDDRFFPVLFIDKKEMKNFGGQLEFFKKRIKNYYEFGFYSNNRIERTFLGFLFEYYLSYYLAVIYKNKIPMGETPISDTIKTK